MSAENRTRSRTVVRARFAEGPHRDYFVIETVHDDDPASRLAYWQDVNDRNGPEGMWTDVHLATETTAIIYERIPS